MRYQSSSATPDMSVAPFGVRITWATYPSPRAIRQPSAYPSIGLQHAVGVALSRRDNAALRKLLTACPRVRAVLCAAS
jgi:hypothetical protein